MKVQKLSIGVFDSGMGGLTVLRALRQALPMESFIYLGDTARLPYGTKSPDTVKQYATQMAKILVERRIKALVIACNTATTAALTHLQALLPDIPVIGVVAPGAQAAVLTTRNQQVMVLATETTIASKAYHNHIVKQLPGARIQNRACSVLVALAEEGMVDNVVARETLKHYLNGIQNEDTLLLGCTHFPVFKPLLSQLLPSEIKIVDSTEATALSLSALLSANNLLDPNPDEPPTVQYLVTDSIARFQSVGALFLGEPMTDEQIQLI